VNDSGLGEARHGAARHRKARIFLDGRANEQDNGTIQGGAWRGEAWQGETSQGKDFLEGTQ